MKPLMLAAILFLQPSTAYSPPPAPVYLIQFEYVAELPTTYQHKSDCDLHRKFIEANPDRPNVHDDLVRTVRCIEVGGM